VNAPSQIALGWKGIDAIVLAEAGVKRRPDGTVEVPYRLADGSTSRVKLFPPGGGSYWAPGEGLIPFGLERLAQPGRRDQRRLWIAEGESDALCLREHYAQWRGKPVDVIGLPGAATWRGEWAAHARGYASVACFADGDEAGERMADMITASITGTIRVRLPASRDVRDLLQSEGADAVDVLIVSGEADKVLWAGMCLCRTLPELERFLSEMTW
jgi:hypothetical protein